MKRYVIPALAVGLLGGWVLRSLFLDPAISAGEVLIAAVTISVGWWIERTVRVHEELNRVPIEAVSKLCDRLDTLISECLEAAVVYKPTDGALVRPLRFLANEITWLGTVTGALKVASIEHESLRAQSYSFKTLLTGGPEVEANLAAEVGRSMRVRVIEIRWKLCKRILDKPGDIGALAADSKVSR